MTKELAAKDKAAEFLLYPSPNGEIKVDVFFHKENIWLTQKRMAELFDIDRSVITKHLQNIFDSKELDEASVSAKIAHTASDGNPSLYGIVRQGREFRSIVPFYQQCLL